MAGSSDVYVILDDVKSSQRQLTSTSASTMRPVAQSEMKEISLDDDDDDIYEYIDEDRDDRHTGRHSLDAVRDAARVANIQPVTQQPPRRRVLVTEGNFF